MITVKSPTSPIKATVIADSMSPAGVRITTYELEVHRYILAEINTHKMLSKNTSSSRAIPSASLFKLIEENPAIPFEWGSNNAGMQSRELLDATRAAAADGVWRSSMQIALSHARVLSDKTGINAHKQIVNRITEPYSLSKIVMTGTEYENLFYLRNHADAQPEFRELARCMIEARRESEPVVLRNGEWHLPYITFENGEYFVGTEKVDVEVAKKVSVSCCAQVSYRKADDSIEKALDIFNRLNLSDSGDPMHASPCEHQATPMKLSYSNEPLEWDLGVTHMRRDGSLWSANFRNWIQYRQTIPGNTKWG
jgi:hypothetical protein